MYPGFQGLAYEGTSFFAELPRLEGKLPSPGSARHAVLVLVLRTAPDVPSSAIVKLLRRYADQVHAAGGRLLLAGLQPPLFAVLRRTGLDDHLGADALVPAQARLFAAVDQAVDTGERWLRARTPTAAPGSRSHGRDQERGNGSA